MKKLFTKLALLLPFFITVGGINYYVDSAYIFNSDTFLDQVTTYLHDQKNVANIQEYNDRVLQKKYIQKLNSGKEIVVLGSSRVWLISSNLFPGQSFFNNGVAGASVQDFLSIINLYEERGYLPKTIILGLDPWLLNKNNGAIRWQSLVMETNQMLIKLGKEDLIRETSTPIEFKKNQLKELFSTKYFKESILNFNKKYYVTLEKEGSYRTKLFDGSIGIEKGIRDRTAKDIDNRARDYVIAGVPYQLNNFHELDAYRINLLESLLQYLLDKDIQVIFFLPPYHPITYNLLQEKLGDKIVEKTELYFLELAKKNNLEVIGSFDPEKLDLSNSDFYDGMHLTRKPIENMFRDLDLGLKE